MNILKKKIMSKMIMFNYDVILKNASVLYDGLFCGFQEIFICNHNKNKFNRTA